MANWPGDSSCAWLNDMSSPTEPPLPDPSGLQYPIHERTLANGLRVIVNPDHAAPVVAVNLWYDVGSRHEVSGRTGFAHLFEHLMFQGSQYVATGEHIGKVQAAGGSVNATTWFDRTNYFEAVPSAALDLALWLEADRMASLTSALTQENLDTQREVVKEEKRQRYDNVPYGDVMELLVELSFPPDHPYGHTTIGSMADLDAASVTDVREFFVSHYMPNNAVLTLAGDVTAEDGFAKAEEYFGEISAATKGQAATPAPLPRLSGDRVLETHAAVPADAVYLAWRLPALDDPEYDALELGLSILGEGQMARLHQRLVRGLDLAEAASASSIGLIGGNSLAVAYARARDGVGLDDLATALRTEIDKLAESGPSPHELARAKAQYERSWLQTLTHVESRADQFGEMATLLGDPNRVNTRLAEIATVSVEEVGRACANWLTSACCATLLYRAAEGLDAENHVEDTR